MVDISRKTYEGNGIETIVDNDRILWLNQKHIEEGLDHKMCEKLQQNIIQIIKEHRYELLKELKSDAI